MRSLSSATHPAPISGAEREDVLIDDTPVNVAAIDDAVLPAARHLTSAGAQDVLRAVVEAARGHLQAARPSHVQYRPGSDLVVRYEATVCWPGGTPTPETLLAATTTAGPLPGTVPLEAETDDGVLSVGVWRWPFDPLLPGLRTAVTAGEIAPILGVAARRLRLDVVAYRPTERAVVRIHVTEPTPAAPRTLYAKVLRPEALDALVERHELLSAAGVPVPAVVATERTAGILVMEELSGPTLRERLKADLGPWPGPGAYLDLTTTMATAPLGSVTPIRGRVSDALGHAAMLAEIAPDQRPLLERLTERLRPALERARARQGPIVHGDLYEAQLVVDGDRIVGLLDIDDVGPGDPFDDLATVLAHLRYRADARAAVPPTATPAIAPERAMTPRSGTGRTDPIRVRAYADALRAGFVEHVDPHELDLVTGAVMIGLATGPFRIQQADWADAVGRHLRTAASMILGDGYR